MVTIVKTVDLAFANPLQDLVADNSPDLHVVTTLDGEYRFLSTTSTVLCGWRPDELIGRNDSAFTHPDDTPQTLAARAAIALGPADPVSCVSRFRCADGTYRWTESLSRLVMWEGEPLVVSAVREIAERMQSELTLQRLATTDPLTGLANRTVFMDRLQQALRRIERTNAHVGVLFLDLDRFKLINDSLGHLMGDAVLLEMAEHLRRCLRPQDTLARLGGDEFAVVIEDMTIPEKAAAMAMRIVEASRAPFVVGDEQFTCTTSVGIAVTADSQHGAEGLLQEADLALYRAKDRGRDRVEVFDEELRTRAVGRLGTERMLRSAIHEGRLRVHYQPIVDLRTGDTVAAEALVRVWDADAGELIVAESFIEVAEETGLLTTMDDWVLRQVLAQAATWRELFPGLGFTDVAVNLTARHLADVGFAQSVIADMEARKLPSGALQIEVTERVLMEASNSAMTGLKMLRDAGVKVGLDDFGTGYSSLSYLRLFPLDFVKIDRSFIRKLAFAATERAIVASIVDLSHALGMAVVAEGVETPAQLEVLTALGCDRAQGFLFASGGPAAGIEDRVLHSATS